MTIQMQLVAGAVPELLIMDEIGRNVSGGGVSIEDVTQFLARNSHAQEITVRVSSCGGDAWMGLAIYEALMNFPGKVRTIGTGIVASAASIIFLAGSIRELSANCQLMIHNAYTTSQGTARDMKSAGEMLGQIDKNSTNIISQRTGQNAKTVQQWLQSETWFDARDAKQFGFATVITGEVQATMSFDTSKFKNVPSAVKRLQPKSLADVVSRTRLDETETRQKAHQSAAMTAAQQAKAYGKPKSMADIYKIQRGEKLNAS